jgi:hypothetical protein
VSRRSIHKTSVWFILMLLFPACALPATSTRQVQPSVPLGTLIAQTAAAAQTQTATAAPSSTPTPTLTKTLTPPATPATSTPTFFFSIFTETSIAIPTETGQAFVGGGGSSGNGSGENATRAFVKEPVPWNCSLISKSPRGGTVPPRKGFYAAWAVRNTGTQSWTSNTIDFQYRGGYRNVERPLQDLQQTIAPGGQVTLQVYITAPKTLGTYNVFWSLKVGNHFFCPLKVTFEVAKPPK